MVQTIDNFVDFDDLETPVKSAMNFGKFIKLTKDATKGFFIFMS